MTKVRENHGTKTAESPIKTSSSQLAGNDFHLSTCPPVAPDSPSRSAQHPLKGHQPICHCTGFRQSLAEDPDRVAIRGRRTQFRRSRIRNSIRSLIVSCSATRIEILNITTGSYGEDDRLSHGLNSSVPPPAEPGTARNPPPVFQCL